MTIEDHGYGTFALGCGQGSLDCEHSRRVNFFSWQEFDEMDEVRGDWSAEMEDDGFLDIEFPFHDSDLAALKARKR